jgi:hypothetical protein
MVKYSSSPTKIRPAAKLCLHVIRPRTNISWKFPSALKHSHNQFNECRHNNEASNPRDFILVHRRDVQTFPVDIKMSTMASDPHLIPRNNASFDGTGTIKPPSVSLFTSVSPESALGKPIAMRRRSLSVSVARSLGVNLLQDFDAEASFKSLPLPMCDAFVQENEDSGFTTTKHDHFGQECPSPPPLRHTRSAEDGRFFLLPED